MIEELDRLKRCGKIGNPAKDDQIELKRSKTRYNKIRSRDMC